MKLIETLPWTEPLNLASGISEKEEKWAMLYSGMQKSYSGRFSIIAMKPEEEIIADDFANLEDKLSENKAKFDNAWFGYFGYDLKNSLEKLPQDSPCPINLPNLWMIRFGLIIVFDHELRNINIWAKDRSYLLDIPYPDFKSQKNQPCINKLSSNMTKNEYLIKLREIKSAIKNGDLYQANLTRKFFGKFDKTPDNFELFKQLTIKNPSAYSCYFKFSDTHIISSSPEMFLSLDDNGNAETRPIKGSSARFSDVTKDANSREALANSTKDKAENLMIVDLMRNDLSRSCEAGSVKTPALYDITSYSTVHHMSSTVQAVKKADISTLSLIKNAFPPGSMTGAPKIKAMELCSKLEKTARGVYSGAIGWLGGNGSCDLSVVIRTLITQSDKFEFQVGGAITHDSDEESEFQETLIKAKPIADILNIDGEVLENL